MAHNMKKWICPKCSESIQCIGTAVSHRCPNDNNNVTEWLPVEEKK